MMDTAMWALVYSASVALLVADVSAVCPYDVAACKCTGTALVCTNLDGIPTLVSDNQDGSITDLTFTYGKLNTISSKNLPAKLQKITFSNVNITSISSDALNSSATTLKSFTMRSLEYPELPDALLTVNSLTDLTVSDVPFTNWTLAVVQHLGKSLRSVVLRNVSLTSWPEWLTDFTLLNSLDFSKNSAENIAVDAFTKVQNLTTLILSDTNFYNITNVNLALQPLSRTLTTLDISYGPYALIPDVVADMSALSKLDISHSILQDITSDAIPRQLKELNASANIFLFSLHDNSFPDASSLEVLNLTINQISSISDLAFQPLTHLRELYLGYTSLQTIPLALTKLNHLQVLQTRGTRWYCPCPRDDTFVRWYASQKPLNATGDCHNYDFTLDYYLSNTTGNSPCSGYSLVSSTSVLYLCVVFVMSVLVMK